MKVKIAMRRAGGWFRKSNDTSQVIDVPGNQLDRVDIQNEGSTFRVIVCWEGGGAREVPIDFPLTEVEELIVSVQNG
ncbi:hypothetical protein HZA45_03755 [Candidatus Peregrinibacteria bacterium]|nr:hypothetical protein [Candidatus Peregrinibacteria bacterium]